MNDEAASFDRLSSFHLSAIKYEHRFAAGMKHEFILANSLLAGREKPNHCVTCVYVCVCARVCVYKTVRYKNRIITNSFINDAFSCEFRFGYGFQYECDVRVCVCERFLSRFI